MDTVNLVLEPNEEPQVDSACPICGGQLIMLRESFRCVQCCHSFCESCGDGLFGISEPPA